MVESNDSTPNHLRRQELETEGCGSVVSFVGLTRGDDDGIAVERLEFDAWEGNLDVLNNLAEHALEQFGVKSVVMAHIAPGSVGPGEPIVCIHVASAHRAEGFEACSWLIDELKRPSPLWKKEVRADGSNLEGRTGLIVPTLLTSAGHVRSNSFDHHPTMPLDAITN